MTRPAVIGEAERSDAVLDIVAFGQTSIDDVVNDTGAASGLLGGPALYVAAVAAALGARCALATKLGTECEELARPLLSRLGISQRWVESELGPATRISLEYCGEQLRHLRIEEGVGRRINAEPFLNDGVLPRIVHLSPAPYEQLLTLSRVMRTRGAPVSFDPHADFNCLPFERIARILKNVDLLFCNEEEAVRITKVDCLNSATDRLMEAGPRIVCVTRGGAGALITTQDHPPLRVSAITVGRPIDYVGAGDAFSAGFLCALLEGYPLDYAGRFGAAAAACILRDFGLRSMPTRALVHSLVGPSVVPTSSRG